MDAKPQSENLTPEARNDIEFAKEISERDSTNFELKKQVIERDNVIRLLQEKERKYLALFDNAQEVFYQTDLNGIILDISPSIERFSHFNKDELIGTSVYTIYYDPEDREILLSAIKKDGFLKDYELRLKTKTNEIKYAAISAHLISDADGKPDYIAGAIRDISVRKQAEMELINLEKAIYTSGEAIFLTDREGVFTFVNPAFTSLYGFTSDEILGKVTPRIIKSGVLDKSVYENFWLTLLNGDEVRGELINKKKDGTLIQIDESITPIIDEDKKIIGFIGIQRDITERKQAEEKLRLLSDAMEAAIDGLAILNDDQQYIFMNKSYAEIHGYDNPDELIGMSWQMFYENEELIRFVQEISPEIRKKGHYQGRTRGKKKDGSIFFQDLTLNTLKNGRIVCTIRDISELINTEQELITAKEKAEESDRLKTAFLNNISHEIRTPFNGILGFLSILQNNELTGSERDEFTNIINQSADRLMNTINDLVEISQIQAGQLKITSQETNITELTEELINRFNKEIEEPGLQFIIHNKLSPSIASIETDSSKLMTILSNLIGNAIKFTKSGSIELAISLKGDFFEFSVKDTGVGIAKSKQPFIFERFNQVDSSVTRQYEGLGLGLSITKSYVEVLGGRIWLESEEGEGTAFYFTIPNTFHPEYV